MTGTTPRGRDVRIGVDIGGTKTDVVALDQHGNILHQLRLVTGYGPEAVVNTAVNAVTRIAGLVGIRASEVASIGIGVPGRVDTVQGRVTHAVNLGVADLELGSELSERLDRSVHVENDVNAAALGAYHLIEAQNHSGRGWPKPSGVGPDQHSNGGHSMAYLNLGTGLAAGIVVSGQLWRGSRGTAGEIGHIPVDPAGPLCPCGQRGCLELMASGSAIMRQWPTTHPRPAQHLFEAADAGDPVAIEARSHLVESVASAVRLLVLTVDTDLVVFGGGIATLGAQLLDGVKAVLAERAQESPFLASLKLAERVRLLPPDFPSSAVGAAIVGSALSAQDATHPLTSSVLWPRSVEPVGSADG